MKNSKASKNQTANHATRIKRHITGPLFDNGRLHADVYPSVLQIYKYGVNEVFDYSIKMLEASLTIGCFNNIAGTPICYGADSLRSMLILRDGFIKLREIFNREKHPSSAKNWMPSENTERDLHYTILEMLWHKAEGKPKLYAYQEIMRAYEESAEYATFYRFTNMEQGELYIDLCESRSYLNAYVLLDNLMYFSIEVAHKHLAKLTPAVK